MNREKNAVSATEKNGGIMHDTPHLFREINRTQQAMIAFFSRTVGTPWSKVSLMRLLAIERPGELDINGLARRSGVTPAAVTRLVQELEREGLVTRRGDPRDKRRSLISLTDMGKENMIKFHERAHHLEDRVKAGLPAADLDTAVRVLSTVRAALEEIYEDPGFFLDESISDK